MSFLDQESTGWPSKMYTRLTHSFRGWHCGDPPHWSHNNYVGSIKQAGLSFCRTEWPVVPNAASAPLDKAGFISRFAEAVKEFLDKTKIAPTTSSWRHNKSSVWIRIMV